MLEMLFPSNLKGHKLEIFAVAFFHTALASAISLLVFGQHASIVIIALIVMLSLPLMQRILELEEKKELHSRDKNSLIRQHGWAFSTVAFYFLGMLFAFLSIYVFFSDDIVYRIFNSQISTIAEINTLPAGSFFDVDGNVLNILLNNLKILGLCVVFSFFFGTGAIYILTWNASVLAAAIGSMIRNTLWGSALSVTGYVNTVTMSVLGYMTHGAIEITAFILGGLAGGIVSVAAWKHDLRKDSRKLARDVGILVAIAAVLLVFAAFVEAYVSPVFFQF